LHQEPPSSAPAEFARGEWTPDFGETEEALDPHGIFPLSGVRKVPQDAGLLRLAVSAAKGFEDLVLWASGEATAQVWSLEGTGLEIEADEGADTNEVPDTSQPLEEPFRPEATAADLCQEYPPEDTSRPLPAPEKAGADVACPLLDQLQLEDCIPQAQGSHPSDPLVLQEEAEAKRKEVEPQTGNNGAR